MKPKSNKIVIYSTFHMIKMWPRTSRRDTIKIKFWIFTRSANLPNSTTRGSAKIVDIKNKMESLLSTCVRSILLDASTSFNKTVVYWESMANTAAEIAKAAIPIWISTFDFSSLNPEPIFMQNGVLDLTTGRTSLIPKTISSETKIIKPPHMKKA